MSADVPRFLMPSFTSFFQLLLAISPSANKRGGSKVSFIPFFSVLPEPVSQLALSLPLPNGLFFLHCIWLPTTRLSEAGTN